MDGRKTQFQLNLFFIESDMSDYKEPFGKVLNSNSLLLSLNVSKPDYGEPN